MDGNLLKYHMARSGKTQKDLGEALGISVKSVNGKILGRTEFRASEIGKISRICELTPDEVMQIFFE